MQTDDRMRKPLPWFNEWKKAHNVRIAWVGMA
jgi:hypothetical protein